MAVFFSSLYNDVVAKHPNTDINNSLLSSITLVQIAPVENCSSIGSFGPKMGEPPNGSETPTKRRETLT